MTTNPFTTAQIIDAVEESVEYWAPAFEYERDYEVSNLGRVRRATGRTAGRILNPYAKRDRYLYVGLSRDGHTRSIPLHRLVLESHVSPRPDGMHACHADGDRGNAALSNLRWDTPSANNLEKREHGTHVTWCGLRDHCSNGHEYTPENTHISPRGARVCRACKWAASVRQYWKKREERSAMTITARRARGEDPTR